jgi:transposase
MSSQADGTPEQIAFGNWVSDHLAYLKEVRGLSMRAACKLAGVSYTQVYAWMGQPEATGYVDASPAAVKRFCERLKLDYNEAAEVLGWVKPKAPEPPADDLDGYIERARDIANHPRTSEKRRRELETGIAIAEGMRRAADAEAKRIIEGVFKELEEDQDAPEH